MGKVEIKFGTDGFRGIIAKEFTFETLQRIICAIALYLKNLKTRRKTVLIGYDSRFMARVFAKFCAEFLKNFGFRVVLSKNVVPTPIIAYAAKYYPDSMGAVMLTASHNPPDYQGIKFIPEYAGPATKDITDKILKHLDKKVLPKEGGSIEEADFSEDYFRHVEGIIDFKTIKKNQPKIIFDGLYSSTIGYFDRLLERNGIQYESYNMHHDPLFGGGLPEPKEKYMKHKKEGCVVFANDGDGDRYGVLDEKGNYISPNIVLAMLLKYLSPRSKTGAMIKTVGVSNIVEVVANKLNIRTITTPVGFKWLSAAMRENETILAGEDSGGLSIGEHIPEKDGIFANLLILEMMTKENKPLYKLVEEIKEFAGCEFHTDRVDVELYETKGAKALQEKFARFDKIADFEIKSRLTIDGLKLFLDDGLSSLLIRKSGTEPLLRFYIESDNRVKVDRIREFVEGNT